MTPPRRSRENRAEIAIFVNPSILALSLPSHAAVTVRPTTRGFNQLHP
jgi:hypothetical protein